MFRRVKSGRGGGTVGRLTDDLITRTSYYEHMTCLALIPFLEGNQGLYGADATSPR